MATTEDGCLFLAVQYKWSNFTFRNGYLNRNNQAAYNANTRSIIHMSGILSNCNIYNLSAIVSSTANGGAEARILENNLTCYNCHLSNIFYNGSNVCQYTEFYHCEMHNISDSINGITNYTQNNIYSQWIAGNRNYFHDNVIKRGSLLIGQFSYNSIIENNIGSNDLGYLYNHQTFVNCLFIGNRGFRCLGAYSQCLRNNVFVNNQWSGGANGYRTETTGTSANYIVKLNNFYDVPLTSIKNMQAAMNNSGVEGKYCYVSGNHFNVKLSALGFVDPENHDYRLKPDSPLLSAGIIFSSYNFTNTNKTAPKNTLDILGRRFKSPNPSVGPIQYFSNEGNLPNDVHPLG